VGQWSWVSLCAFSVTPASPPTACSPFSHPWCPAYPCPQHAHCTRMHTQPYPPQLILALTACLLSGMNLGSPDCTLACCRDSTSTGGQVRYSHLHVCIAHHLTCSHLPSCMCDTLACHMVAHAYLSEFCLTMRSLHSVCAWCCAQAGQACTHMRTLSITYSQSCFN
jgi:hypothetical protein